MKKAIAIILTIAMLIPCTVIAVDKGLFTMPENKVTYEQAHQFADELKAMKGNTDYRLIVSANKKIDYMNAVSVAEGIEGLYVFQYNSLADAQEAEKYYNSLSYVNSVEYDSVQKVECEIDEFDFVAQDYSTINCNIDDAIKLLKKENYNFPEMKIGIIDSGIAKTNFTKDRLLDGYSYLDGYSSNGTSDLDGHGTNVAGTVILNTLNNVKVVPYQILDSKGNGSLADSVSAFYLAVADGCKIINCSYRFTSVTPNQKQLITEALDYAVNNGVIVVCGAGNESSNLSTAGAWPAKCENAITVGAVTQSNTIASFSNYGTGVDIYATGKGMISYSTSGSKYYGWSGTSAAAPVISAICSNLLIAKPDLTSEQAKTLLSKTGNATFENMQNDKNRVVADAYSAVKELTGKELPQVNFEYSISKNPDTIYTDFSLTYDESATAYYNLGLGGNIIVPYADNSVENNLKHTSNSTISLEKWQTVTACAYAPGKAKSKLQMFMAPIYYYDSGYLLNTATTGQPYNKISRCQLNDITITVPEYIDDSEVQEIGKYCFTGNQSVETIILPYTVKQIDEYAFANCPNLKTVIATGVESCGRYAFYQCENLEQVIMPKVTEANTGIFKNCCSLSELEIGTLDMICNQAFYCCENLRFLDISDEVTSFCYNTFDNCNSLTVKVVEGSFMEEYANERGIPIGERTVIEECLHTNFVITAQVNSTCYTKGYTTYQCDNCGYTFTEENEAFEHNYITYSYEPTCNECGYTQYICSICDDMYFADFDYNYAPHDWDITVRQNPTIMVPGKADYYCWNCGKQEQHYIPALYDFNEDVFVNAKDYAILIRNINGYENDTYHNYDLNGDNVINMLDADCFSENFSAD